MADRMIDTEKLWIYDYSIKYYSHLLSKDICGKGILLAESSADAIVKLSNHYLDEEDDFDRISISAREDGDVFSSLVFENFSDYDD